MHFLSAATILSLVASALAYAVSKPGTGDNWTTTGPNVVNWSRVSTDAQNFTIVLSNQSKFPPYQQVLVALVNDPTQTSITVNPPSGGWVAGDGYQVNLVKSPDELTSIYAQSTQFSIKQATGSTFSTNTGTGPSNTLSVAPTNTVAAGQNGSPTSSGSDSSQLNPTSSPNAAHHNVNMQAGGFVLLAFLGSLLA